MIIAANEVLTLVRLLISTAMGIWSSARKILGKEAIPEWKNIISDIEKSQAAVEEEKKKYEGSG